MATAISLSAEPTAPRVGQPRAAVTTVVVTYNGRRHVEACLDSLLSSGVADLLVVDNASTDGTPELVERAFPAARLVRLPANVGYGGAVNRVAALARGEYLAVVNQDLVVEPGWLQTLVAALDADPAAALATPLVLLADRPGLVNACGNLPHYSGVTVCRDYRQPAVAFSQTEVVPAVSGAALVVRREVFQRLGGFDPLFFMYLEDTDLSLRAALAGWRCLAVPTARVRHDFTPRFSADKLGYLERNRHLMLLKLYRGRTLLLLAPALLLVEALVLAYCAARGPGCLHSKLCAYAWLLARLPSALRARRRVQAQRRVPDAAIILACSPELALDTLEHPLGRLAMRLVNPALRGWHRLAGALIRW